jgi:hypothetical protein
MVTPEGQRMVTPEGQRMVTPEGQRMVTPEGQRMVTPEGQRLGTKDSQLKEAMDYKRGTMGNEHTETKDQRGKTTGHEQRKTIDQQENQKDNSKCAISFSNCQLACKSCAGGGPASCQQIYESNPSSKSGEYTLRVNGTNIKKYCKFGNIAGVQGGWTRFGKLNVQEEECCPQEFALREDSVIGKSCSRTDGSANCVSVKFPSDGIKYSRVSGKVTAYQFSTPNGFRHDHSTHKVDDNYVDGISITRGSNPRKHVFTLAVSSNEIRQDSWGCPCSKKPTARYPKPPDFVGKDYYCESGNPINTDKYILFNQDALFDGEKCRSNEAKCCECDDKHFPYFFKDIHQFTNDSLEMRLCADESTANEDAYITEYEFYVN